MPITIFLSPSIHDDATVTALRKALEPRGVSVWADSQRLSAGDALTARIQEAIREPQHFRADIEKFCKARRLIDLVPGHVVLGLLRRIVLLAVRRQSGRNLTVDNDALRVLLAGEIWSGPLSADHQSLRRKLIRAVREAEDE